MQTGDVAAPVARMVEAILTGAFSRLEPLSLAVHGLLSVVSTPEGDLGNELVAVAGTYTLFQAIRETPESAGTTTVQLEADGVVVAGSDLSWTSADAAFARKSVAVSVAAVTGTRVSLRLTSVGTDAKTVIAKVS